MKDHPPRPEVKENDDTLMQFFDHRHLPPKLQAVSEPFSQLADRLMSTLPENRERSMALRKLLEAKDCAVRAAIYR